MTDFTQSVKDPYGEEYQLDNKPITLGRLCVLALSSQLVGDDQEAVEDKVKRGDLAFRIGDSEKTTSGLSLSDEERVLVSDRVSRTFASAALISSIIRSINET